MSQDNKLGKIFSHTFDIHSCNIGVVESMYMRNNKNIIKNGVFVECGASDGILQSNTCSLERKYNWGGFLIEGNDLLFNALQRNRPNTVNIHGIISDIDEKSVLFENRYFRADVSNSEYLGNSKILPTENTSIFSDERKAFSMTTILKNNNCPTGINFMIIDVENSFYDALLGIDFDYFRIEFIGVEMDYVNNKQQFDKALRLLFSKNYHIVDYSHSGPDFLFKYML